MGPFIVTADDIAIPRCDPTVGERHAEQKFQHQRHGAQHPALYRVGPPSTPWSRARASTGTNHRGLSAFQDGTIELLESVGRLRVKCATKLKPLGARHAPGTRTEGTSGAHTGSFRAKYGKTAALKRATSGRAAAKVAPSTFSCGSNHHGQQEPTLRHRLEEHYWTPRSQEFRGGGAQPRAAQAARRRRRAAHQGDGRAGIDVQVLSHGAPSTQRVEAASAGAARQARERSAPRSRARTPGPFRRIRALPTADPKAAADELRGARREARLQGAMVHGPRTASFFDDKRFWPTSSSALRHSTCPLYLHPSLPMKAVVDAYYGDYLGKYPQLQSAAWGLHGRDRDAGHSMVLSGVFEKYPGLKIILGHLGESLPFSAWRIDMCLSRGGQPKPFPRDLQPAFLDHHERQLLHPGADVLHHGNGRRPDTVLGGLPLRAQPARNEVDGGILPPSSRTGRRSSRQLQAAAERCSALPLLRQFPKNARAGRGPPGAPSYGNDRPTRWRRRRIP